VEYIINKRKSRIKKRGANSEAILNNVKEWVIGLNSGVIMESLICNTVKGR